MFSAAASANFEALLRKNSLAIETDSYAQKLQLKAKRSTFT